MTRSTGVGRGRRNHHTHMLARVFARIPERPPGDCWIWPGSKTAGYGYIQVKRPDGRWIPERVHRLVYQAILGPLPKGMTLDHLCRNPACCNPAHLEPVSNGENVRRSDAPTHVIRRSGACGRGHPHTPQNYQPRPNGSMRCMECSREDARRQAARKKAAA